MSARPDPRQFGRRHDAAGWTLRGRIEQRRKGQAKFAAVACALLFVVALFAALQLNASEGGRVLLVVLAFGALMAGQAAAGEA